MRVICIVGLPGSGKSHLAKELHQINPELVIFDDLTKGSLDAIIKTIHEGKSVILVDVNFCRSSTREVAEHLLRDHEEVDEVEWIFFENNPEQCRKNVSSRQESGDVREVEGTIERYSKFYEVPENIEPRSVYGTRR